MRLYKAYRFLALLATIGAITFVSALPCLILGEYKFFVAVMWATVTAAAIAAGIIASTGEAGHEHRRPKKEEK